MNEDKRGIILALFVISVLSEKLSQVNLETILTTMAIEIAKKTVTQTNNVSNFIT